MQTRHEFAPGDRVEWLSMPRNMNRRPYRVVQQLPENDSGELQYRIRGEGEATDRVVTQTQLASRRSTSFDA